jgi:hypothetical protein
MSTFDFPFDTDTDQDICDTGVCPTNPPDATGIYCGGSLVIDDPSSVGCTPCSDAIQPNDVKFLGAYIIGFNGRLGYNGSESYVTIDLATDNDPTKCSTFTDEYGETHNCSPSGCAPTPVEYTGQLGFVYTFKIGSFCFRGILTNHDYVEGDGGYRYKVNLSDGRQILSNVSVILNDLYIRVPEDLYPNVINVLYENESSVSNDCVDGKKCHDLNKSGNGHKGMLLKNVLEKIDGKQIQLPITGACLEIDLEDIISIVPSTIRVSSSESNVLELISLACEETGHDFFVNIDEYTMKVKPISHKVQTDSGENAPLFQFLSELSDNYIVYDRQYGEELTFENSNKLIIGDNKRYLIEVDTALAGSGCVKNDPGSIFISSQSAISADSTMIPNCIVVPSP